MERVFPFTNAHFGEMRPHELPIWLVGLSFERETRKFLAGVAERF